MSADDEREFRLRPRKPRIPRDKSERAWAVAFKTISHYARTSRTAKRSNNGRGARQAYMAVPRKQRCAIRVTYSRNSVKGQWRAHGRYIARESAASEPTAAGFDRDKSGIDMAALLNSWQAAGDSRMWKVIVSPEFGERVDLIRLTRDLMKRVEKDLAVPLEWVCVAHFNTEHPHVHVALRGVGPDRQEIHLARDYVRSAIRAHAEDLCTRQLGHRTEFDIAESERREIQEKRFTSLDRIILRTAQPLDEDQLLQVTIPIGSREPGENDSAWNRRQHLIARMKVLEDMSAARMTGTGIWSVRADLESVLRAMQRVGDRQKLLAAHGALLSDERLSLEVLDFRKTSTVEGRVLVHGEHERSGRRHMLLEGVDARVHLIVYTREIEEARARGDLRANSFVRLRRILIDQQTTVEIRDLGDSETLLKCRAYFEKKAQDSLMQGILPSDDGWGGWLGRYQSELSQTAIALQNSALSRDRTRPRDGSRDR